MTDVFKFTPGDSPLLVSIPHDGRELAPGMVERMTDTGRSIPDTDWHVRRLYEFATELGASVLAANHSRYVVDLNRPADDSALYEGQVSTGICPERTFAGEPIYEAGEGISADERQARVMAYWRPYHEQLRSTLDENRAKFGYALLWDAHSIAAEVPLLFDGVLPDLNIGTNDGNSCDPGIADAVMDAAGQSSLSSVLNGRFRGGYITREYGRPVDNLHAVQLELTQRNYMDEASFGYDETKAALLAPQIGKMLAAFLRAAEKI